MHEYTDARGLKWAVEINVATLRRMRALANFDLHQVMPKEYATKEDASKAISAYVAFINDDIRFAEVLFAILKPQADAYGVSQEQFEEGLSGEANQRAITAFHGAFSDFSQSPLKTLLRGLKVGLDKVGKKMAKMEAEMTDERLEKMFDEAEASNLSVGGSPAQLESMQTTSP